MCLPLRGRGLRAIELSACIEWLFAEEPVFADRIPRAAAAGLRCVEFWGWRERDLGAIRAQLDDCGVELTAFMSQPAGRLTDPRTHRAVVDGVSESARAAALLGIL